MFLLISWENESLFSASMQIAKKKEFQKMALMTDNINSDNTQLNESISESLKPRKWRVRLKIWRLGRKGKWQTKKMACGNVGRLKGDLVVQLLKQKTDWKK